MVTIDTRKTSVVSDRSVGRQEIPQASPKDKQEIESLAASPGQKMKIEADWEKMRQQWQENKGKFGF